MTRRKQRGVILVFLVIVVAVLLGIAAFSLDIGRLFVLKTELQNAADAAALAAAKELNASSGAVARAKAAAKGLIQEESFFANVKEVLSPDLVEGEDISFKFFCAIENDLDDAGEPLADCGTFLLIDEDANDNGILDTGEDLNGNGRLDRKVEVPEAHTDADTYVHYVEVVLNPKTVASETSDRYKIPLYFLPALRAIGVNAPTEAPTSARALAGRQYRPCRYPPLMMCNPAELDPANEIQVGDMVVIRTQGGPASSWAPGNFGFLIPAVCMGPDGENICGGSTKNELENQLANEVDMGCQPPYVSTYTGQKMSSSIEPMNTRFGIKSTNDRPAAPNVIDYPRDDSVNTGTAKACTGGATPDECRIGDGIWSVSGDDPAYPTFPLYPPALSESDYRSNYFSSSPSAMTKPSRYNHYLQELSSTGVLPGMVTGSALDNGIKTYNATVPKSQQIQDCPSNPKNTNDLEYCVNLYGDPDAKPGSTPVGDANRRVLYVASLNCVSQGVKGNTQNIYVPPPPAGWKKFFLTEHVGKQGTDGAAYYAEYLGPASESDGNFDVIVQLYE